MGRARELADGGINDAILMDASASDTDVNDNILLEGTDSTSTNAGFNLLYENGTHDAAITLPVGRDNLSLTGGIVQVKQSTRSGFTTLTNSGTAAVFADIFLEVDIAPTSASNKILLMANLAVATNTADRAAHIKFIGGNTADFYSGRAIGSRTPCHHNVYFGNVHSIFPVSMQILDSPATTDSIKYEVRVAPADSTGNLFINRVNGDSDSNTRPNPSSIITAIEVTA